MMSMTCTAFVACTAPAVLSAGHATTSTENIRVGGNLEAVVELMDGRYRSGTSAIEEDLPEAELPGGASLSPWLASIFVVPEARGGGIGRALVERAVVQAAGLGIETLYLFTAGQEAFYRRLGWSVRERVLYHGREGAIMYKPLTV